MELYGLGVNKGADKQGERLRRDHMSYNWDIVTALKPEPENIREFLVRYSHLVPLGELGQPDMFIRNVINAEAFTIYGPWNADDEDVPRETLHCLPDIRFLTQITVPLACEASMREQALDLAVYLAEMCRGVVWDPQKGDIIHCARRLAGRAEKDTLFQLREGLARLVDFMLGDINRRSRADVLSMELFFMRTLEGRQFFTDLIEFLQKSRPEVLPRRFGMQKPLDGRVIRNDYGEFIDTAANALQRGEMLFFRASPPCISGVISGSRTAGSGRGHIQLELSFDCRPLYNSRAACDGVCGLMVTIARLFRAIYGGAFVMQRCIVANGSYGFDSRSEYWNPMPMGDEWIGIPESPMWLSWFGGPYKDLVAPALRGFDHEDYEEGSFLRIGPRPLNRRCLRKLADKGRWPLIPSRLVIQDKGAPALYIPELK